MKTTRNTERNFLQELVESYDFYQNNFKQREYLISNFERMKPTTPFSNLLNNWVLQWYNNHKGIFVFSQEEDDFDPLDTKGTLKRYIDRYKKNNIIVINANNLENSIYGDEIGLYARCIHEYLHLTLELPYNPLGETLAGIYNANMLPVELGFERQLIIADIVGQLLYYYKHRSYVIDQRRFCIDFLKNPFEAVYTLQQKN